MVRGIWPRDNGHVNDAPPPSVPQRPPAHLRRHYRWGEKDCKQNVIEKSARIGPLNIYISNMFRKNIRRAFNLAIIIILVFGRNNNVYTPRVPSPVVYRVGAHALDFRAAPNTLLVPHPPKYNGIDRITRRNGTPV